MRLVCCTGQGLRRSPPGAASQRGLRPSAAACRAGRGGREAIRPVRAAVNLRRDNACSWSSVSQGAADTRHYGSMTMLYVVNIHVPEGACSAPDRAGISAPTRNRRCFSQPRSCCACTALFSYAYRQVLSPAPRQGSITSISSSKDSTADPRSGFAQAMEMQGTGGMCVLRIGRLVVPDASPGSSGQ